MDQMYKFMCEFIMSQDKTNESLIRIPTNEGSLPFSAYKTVFSKENLANKNW